MWVFLQQSPSKWTQKHHYKKQKNNHKKPIKLRLLFSPRFVHITHVTSASNRNTNVKSTISPAHKDLSHQATHLETILGRIIFGQS